MSAEIQLNSTTDQLAVVTSANGAIDAYTSWVDMVLVGGVATGQTLPGRNNQTQIVTATTTPIVPSPGANISRNVHAAMIRNAGTLPNTVTVQHSANGGTNWSTLASQVLAPGDALHFNMGRGWTYVPASSSVAVPGRLLSSTVVVSGTTYTTGALTNTVRVRAWGGGGAGGGCTSVAAAASAGGGGGAGGYGEAVFPAAPSTTYAIAIGTAGAGVSGAGGGNGGATTFGPIGGVTLTANGGSGAPVATAVTTASAYAGGAGGAAGSGGIVNAPGAPGEPGTVSAITPIGVSGNGGSSLVGQGGLGIIAVGTGSNATGNGSGGAGAITGASAARAGGNGTVGMLIVDEYA